MNFSDYFRYFKIGKEILMHRFCLVALIGLVLAGNCYGQERSELKRRKHEQANDTLPYQKYPTLPAFNIMLLDSATIFNTYNIPEDRPVVILFFDPDCKHCKAEIKVLLAGMDSLKDTRFYIITSVHDFQRICDFYAEYHLGDYKNIEVVGRDYEYFFITYYGVKFVPDLVLYDERKNLVKFFDGHVSIGDLYKLTHQETH